MGAGAWIKTKVYPMEFWLSGIENREGMPADSCGLQLYIIANMQC